MITYEYSRASVEHPERNEDATLIFHTPGKAPVFAMIDGMGGHQRTLPDGTVVTGREAAQMVRATFIEDLGDLLPDVDASPGGLAEREALAALGRAHERVLNQLNGGTAHPLNERVGAVATIAIVCENGGRLLVAQVGDTRAYLSSAGELIQVCYDEDNIQYLVEQGMLSDADGVRITDVLNSFDGVTEPRVSGTVTIGGSPYELYLAWRWFVVGNSVLNIPPANIVIKSLGIVPDMSSPQVSRIEIAPGDSLFMCSDGVYKNLTDAELLAGLNAHDNAAEWLGSAAFARSEDRDNRRSTQDDVSALLVRL
ncbi:MAG: protein phosphatase 2C domain-containing protein [bacterium]|nr:protein phosphatase 2C domain-containing protein [bacterium]